MADCCPGTPAAHCTAAATPALPGWRLPRQAELTRLRRWGLLDAAGGTGPVSRAEPYVVALRSVLSG